MTVRHLFPDWTSWLAAVKDPRDPMRIVYPISYLLGIGLAMFLTRLGARRQIRFQFGTGAFVQNLNVLCGTKSEAMAHPDTLAYLTKRLDPQELMDLRTAMIRRLIRQKCFEKDRLLDRFYRIAIDGTGHLTFAQRHCAGCLTHSHDGRVLYYYHSVLEAKLVTRSGLALSIATEFIENPAQGADRQDCERRALERLAQRLKTDFPQLRICLLLDGLYACGPVFDLCRRFDWRFVITFKEGSAPAVFADYEQLRQAGGSHLRWAEGPVPQEFSWVNGVDFSGHRVNVLESQEDQADGLRRRFVWVTDLALEPTRVVEVANEGGRLRWKIENEGFNIQKNHGYALEHAYCESPNAAKNYYLLLQIAHLLAQLLERGILKDRIRKQFGALRNVARFLLEQMRQRATDPETLARLLSRRIQIRFGDTS